MLYLHLFAWIFDWDGLIPSTCVWLELMLIRGSWPVVPGMVVKFFGSGYCCATNTVHLTVMFWSGVVSVRCSSLRCCVWLEDLLRGVCSLIELQNWHPKGREKYPVPSLQTCWGLHPVSKPSRMHDARHYSPARGQSNPVSMNGADVPGAICAVCTRSDFLKKKRDLKTF